MELTLTDGAETFRVLRLEPVHLKRVVLFGVGAGGNPERHLGLIERLVEGGARVVAPHFERLKPPDVPPEDLEMRARRMRLALGGGSYAFRCQDDAGGAPVTGPVTRISGPAGGSPGIVPVTTNDLYAPAQSYTKYVMAGLDRLNDRTDALRAAVHDGDLDAARAAWTPAHLAYERLGAAYGTFGDFDGAIDGTTAGLPGGVHDPDFTGFHRLEYGLWHGESASSLREVADRLDHDTHALKADFADQRMDPADLPLRAHEILENTLQFQLTGRADEGSGTTLRTAAANIEGTREVLSVLRPVLQPRFTALPQVYAWLDRMDALLKGRSSVDDLSTADRERLNGVTGQVLELLSSVATIAEPRRIS